MMHWKAECKLGCTFCIEQLMLLSSILGVVEMLNTYFVLKEKDQDVIIYLEFA